MREFTCALCGHVYIANESRDAEMRDEFVSRYGHKPEETVDDKILSLCDSCNDEYELRCMEVEDEQRC